ncbi:MAG TPA: lamin tail domain-containing protein [Candidatus Nanoarchaeia archaeon]
MLAQTIPLLKKLWFLQLILLTVTTSFYFFTPSAVAADFLKVTAPSEILPETSFEINLEISASPNTSYFIKARLGKQTNDLRAGQTFNPNQNLWLSDTVSWDKFPQFQTDSDGYWVGKIQGRSTKTAPLGQNYLAVRIRTGSANIDSATYSLVIKEQEQKEETGTPTVVDQIGEPSLNEFVAQPGSGTEWVEIKNKGTGPADLSGWWVDDEPGKSSPYEIPAGTIIGAGNFLVVNFSSPKLNDLTDSVRLLKPDGTEVESFRYDTTVKGESWAKDEAGSWFANSNPTPGAENPPNPTVLAATSERQLTSKNGSNQLESDDPEETPGPKFKIPQVLAATTSATVSAQVGNTDKNPINTPLVVLGSLLLAFGGLVILKRKLKDRVITA